jgi:hypothetical protein
MNSKAQSGLEYLMTYGWALVLITAAIGIFAFLVSSPVQEITFSSSDPKILFTSGAMQGSIATAMLKNGTGGRITISSITAVGNGYTGCTINEETTNINVGPGGTMELNCPITGDDPTGTVTIAYSDYANLQRNVIISVSGGAGGTPGELCQSGGSGTLEDPYILTTIAEVQAIPASSENFYELCANIDASETTTWNGGEGFVPVDEFRGNFDGKGYAITGLYINRPGSSHQGMFNTLSGTVANLSLVNASVSGGNYTGALAGNNDGAVSKSYSTGTVTSNGTYSGGLVGSNIGLGSITNSYSRATVNGNASVGGLAGINAGTAQNSYSTGAVTGNSNVGGIIGENTATCTNFFWDTETSGQGASACGTGKTTAQMMAQATFVDWDFATVWNINEGTSYPFLR